MCYCTVDDRCTDRDCVWYADMDLCRGGEKSTGGGVSNRSRDRAVYKAMSCFMVGTPQSQIFTQFRLVTAGD